jgi:hypothetical protein
VGDCIEVFADDAWWQTQVMEVLTASTAAPQDVEAAAAAAAASAAVPAAAAPAVAPAAEGLLVRCFVMTEVLTLPVKVGWACVLTRQGSGGGPSLLVHVHA